MLIEIGLVQLFSQFYPSQNPCQVLIHEAFTA